MEKAVELDPGRIYHRLDLAVIYADRKRYADARQQLDKVAELPDREVMDPVVPPTGGRSRGETRRSGIAYRLLVECVSRLVGGSIDPCLEPAPSPTQLSARLCRPLSRSVQAVCRLVP